MCGASCFQLQRLKVIRHNENIIFSTFFRLGFLHVRFELFFSSLASFFFFSDVKHKILFFFVLFNNRGVFFFLQMFYFLQS